MFEPPRRTQADRTSETRALLIRATTELLQTTGFAGITTSMIAKRAGVTTGALHHHFATKDDLMFGVFDQATERVRVRLEHQGEAASGFTLDATKIVAHLWEVYGEPEYWAIWEIIIGARADVVLHQRIVADRLATMRTVIHPWVERHVLADAARPEAITLFEFMLVAIRGLSLERFMDKDAAYFERNLTLLAEMVGHKLAQLHAITGAADET